MELGSRQLPYGEALMNSEETELLLLLNTFLFMCFCVCVFGFIGWLVCI